MIRDDTQKPFKNGKEMNGQLDLDTRTATLTVNDVTRMLVLSASVTGINSIDFGFCGATTLFTEPEIKIK